MVVLAVEAGLCAELGSQGDATVSGPKPGSRDITEPSCKAMQNSHRHRNRPSSVWHIHVSMPAERGMHTRPGFYCWLLQKQGG